MGCASLTTYSSSIVKTTLPGENCRIANTPRPLMGEGLVLTEVCGCIKPTRLFHHNARNWYAPSVAWVMRCRLVVSDSFPRRLLSRLQCGSIEGMSPRVNLLIGLAAVGLAVMETLTGQSLQRYGRTADRSDDPKNYWGAVIIGYAAGLFFIGRYIYLKLS